MELRTILVAVVATLACLLNSSPAGVSALPPANSRDVRLKQLEELQSTYNDTQKKNRYNRETSESVLLMATTPELPLTEPTTTEEPEGSAAGIQSIRCNKIRSDCKSLKERLIEYFERPPRYQIPLDSFYNAFVLDDIYYFGLLGGAGGVPESQSSRDYGVYNCQRILQAYQRPQTISSGVCSWNYTCTYDTYRFPRFRIEASILDREHLDRGPCIAVTMERVTYFRREKCPGDPCERENWVKDVADNIVVGYQKVDS